LLGEFLVGEADAREELTQDVGLLRDPLDLVALGIRVARLDFLVGVLVAQRVLLDRSDNISFELVAIFDKILSTVLVEKTIINCAIYSIFREPS